MPVIGQLGGAGKVKQAKDNQQATACVPQDMGHTGGSWQYLKVSCF